MSEPLFEYDRRDYDTDCRLRSGLRSLPVPELSADFDARIQAALRQPIPWWRVAWANVRPILAPTACSFIVMLALLQGMSNAPLNAARLTSSGGAGTLSQERRARLEALDQGMEHRDLSNASLIGCLKLGIRH